MGRNMKTLKQWLKDIWLVLFVLAAWVGMTGAIMYGVVEGWK